MAASGSRVCIADCRDLTAGDAAVATSLLYVDGGDASGRYAIAKVGPDSAVLAGDEDAWVGVACDGVFERGGVAIGGAAFCVSPVSISVVAGRSLRWGAVSIETTAPCNSAFDPASGHVTVEADRDVGVRIGTEMHALQAGTHVVPAGRVEDVHLRELKRAIREDAAAPGRRFPTVIPEDLPSVSTPWRTPGGAYAAHTAYHAADVDGDGRGETVVGMPDGRVVCLDGQGAERWEFATGGAVRAIAHATLRGRPTVLAGSEDEYLYALDVEGTLLWKHRCHFSEEKYRRAPWWTMGGKAVVVAIHPADLDGDGEAEVVCGTGMGFVEVLTGDGNRKWLCAFEWGIPDRFNVVPMPDGCNHLLVDATRSACGSWTWRFDADGKILDRNAFDTGRGSWDATRVTASEAVDMDGRGAWMAVLGRGGAHNELALHDAVTGARKWVHPLADRASAVATADLDGDSVKEVLVGSRAAWVNAFDIDGALRWAVALPGEAVDLAADGGDVYARCSDGRTYRLSGAGEVTGVHVP